MTSLIPHLNSVSSWWLHWMTAMTWQLLVLAALVWLLAARGRLLSAGARHLLWLLVFVKLLIPPGFASPWAVGNVLAGYDIQIARVETDLNPESGASAAGGTIAFNSRESGVTTVPEPLSAAAVAFAVWSLVATGLLGLMLAQYHWHKRNVMAALSAPGEEVLRVFEEEKQRLRVRTPVSLFVSENMVSPGLFGAAYPMVVLPQAASLRREDLRAVLAHELAHVKRRDVAAGWVTMVLSCLYWFHPAVWLANLYLRREREMACDDMVLRSSAIDGGEYASTILSVAKRCNCRAPVGAGALGILEYSDNLMARVRSCADNSRARKMGMGAMALIVAVLLVLPMGDWDLQAASASAPPEVVSTSPQAGASGIDPATPEIKITFDQDMDTQGYSWTGGGEFFPELASKPKWLDARTCIMPVKLKEDRFYRVGINSSSNQNFGSVNGTPAIPYAIYFATRGAGEKDLAALIAPKAVSLSPANEATNVTPGTIRAVVTFDQPMEKGISFVILDDQGGFPKIADQPIWSADGKSITVAFVLEPNGSYAVGLNSQRYINFTSDHGVPLAPVIWKFQTGN